LLNYAELEGVADSTQKKSNKFFAAKAEERERNERQRPDKHLLPVEKKEFRDPKTGKQVEDEWGKLPFQTIDIIFNHKNIWSNLQNPNPAAILYHIHDNTKWLPYVFEPLVKHPKIIEDEKNEKNEGEGTAIAKGDEEEIKKAKASKGGKLDDKRLLTMKDYGDYMRPFMSFYDPKALEPPMTGKQVDKVEAKIFKEVEIAIK